MTDYLELAKEVVKRASANNVQAEAVITQDTETQIKVNKGEVEQLSQSSGRGLGVRVIDGGRTGYAYTSDFSEDGIEQTWRTALELSAVASADEFRTLPDSRPIPDEDLEIWDVKLANVATAEKLRFCEQSNRP